MFRPAFCGDNRDIGARRDARQASHGCCRQRFTEIIPNSIVWTRRSRNVDETSPVTSWQLLLRQAARLSAQSGKWPADPADQSHEPFRKQFSRVADDVDGNNPSVMVPSPRHRQPGRHTPHGNDRSIARTFPSLSVNMPKS